MNQHSLSPGKYATYDAQASDNQAKVPPNSQVYNLLRKYFDPIYPHLKHIFFPFYCKMCTAYNTIRYDTALSIAYSTFFRSISDSQIPEKKVEGVSDSHVSLFFLFAFACKRKIAFETKSESVLHFPLCIRKKTSVYIEKK